MGKLIAAEWKNVAVSLESDEQTEYQTLLNLDAVYPTYMATEVYENRNSISALLTELASTFERYYESEEWVCILGM